MFLLFFYILYFNYLFNITFASIATSLSNLDFFRYYFYLLLLSFWLLKKNKNVHNKLKNFCKKPSKTHATIASLNSAFSNHPHNPAISSQLDSQRPLQTHLLQGLFLSHSCLQLELQTHSGPNYTPSHVITHTAHCFFSYYYNTYIKTLLLCFLLHKKT